MPFSGDGGDRGLNTQCWLSLRTLPLLFDSWVGGKWVDKWVMDQGGDVERWKQGPQRSSQPFWKLPQLGFPPLVFLARTNLVYFGKMKWKLQNTERPSSWQERLAFPLGPVQRQATS